ncbi:HNH endonuclease [Pseudomonas akapageensis]|uniref:HNH endonuclease n=1 Tax=Pseudomonas akapageensis TaxID=2609961 RepID=UPI00140DA3D8|nr:HNH endonuclease [Pseudomonas akapageensis]
MTTQGNEKWTDAELAASVTIYLEMLELERSGQPLNKAQFNRQLRDGQLASRSPGSVEFRMQNISAVLAELCLEWIKGYPPRGNVGTQTKATIMGFLQAGGALVVDDYEATESEEVLEAKVAKLMLLELSSTPAGIKKPIRSLREASVFLRDPLVKAWILQNAKGICEGCGDPAPFKLADGRPFLEVHHVRPLKAKGSDCTSNAVALCPNCHRRCHLADDSETFTHSLYEKNLRLVRE